MEPIALSLLVGGGLAFGILAHVNHARYLNELETVWTRAAEVVGGRSERAKGLFTATRFTLSCTIGRIAVVADVAVEKSAVTRARVASVETRGLDLGVSSENLVGALASAFRLIADVEVGDRAFDDRFVVKTNDLGLARAWLSRDVRALMLHMVKWRFSVAHGRVEVTRHGYPNTAPIS